MRASSLTLSLLITILAGCGGSQTPMLQGLSPQADRSSKSWMLSEAKSEDLVYVSDDIGDVYAYSYPNFKVVGKLDIPTNTGTEGLCADAVGDVFVPAWTFDQHATGYVYEFAHGGTEPIQTLTDDEAINTSCAVDPTTGNLALADFGGVYIFPKAQGTPTYYSLPNSEAEWSAYDPDGDLFVSDGAVAVLPKGGSDFANVTFNYSIEAASIQWNDGYLTIVGYHSNPDEYEPVYRAQISGTIGTIAGKTDLEARHWAYDGNGQVLIQGKKIIGPGTQHVHLDVWRYPQGGAAIKVAVRHFTPWGIVISPGPSRARSR